MFSLRSRLVLALGLLMAVVTEGNTDKIVDLIPRATNQTEATVDIALSAEKASAVAKKKCHEYSQLVYEEPINQFHSNDTNKGVPRCLMVERQLLAGGVPAAQGEFPHIVALGFEPRKGDVGDIAWMCVGGLISARFVLTAAHCTSHYRLGPVRWAQLGSTRLNDAVATKIKVIEAINHPDYSEMSRLNDIALVKLESSPKLTPLLRPACVGISTDLQVLAPGAFGGRYYVPGWRFYRNGGNVSQVLMKVDLYEVDKGTCETKYEFLSKRLQLNVIDHDSMLCIGNNKLAMDSCQVGLGGPAMARMADPYCMYDIRGISSFGESICGGDNLKVDVHTRVRHFLPWIVSIVWPEETGVDVP